jgi:hypothetical protein
MKYYFTSADNSGFGGVRNGYKGKEMLEKMEVGKDTKECFTEMSKNRKNVRWIGESDDAIGFPRIVEEHGRTQTQEVQDRVPQNHGTQRFQEYLQKGNLLLRLRAIGSQLDFGEDPYSLVLAQLLETFCSYVSPLKDLQLLHLQSWTCSAWEPSQCHEFRLGDYERG